MFSSVKKRETTIDVILDEPLTGDSCVKLVIQLINHVLYQKQQIPFSYESLFDIYNRIKLTNRNSSSIKNFLESIKNISDDLSSEFLDKNSKIKEIVIIVGATIWSPKLYVRLELPSQILRSQKHGNYSLRKPLENLMSSLMKCSEFQDAMNLSQNATNTFVLLQKSDRSSRSEYFLPKLQFIPQTHRAACFYIKLEYNEESKSKCKCLEPLKVYHDVVDPQMEENAHVHNENQLNEEISDAPYRWYQSKDIIKGFKFSR